MKPYIKSMDSFFKLKLTEIKNIVKDDKVLLAISGGVDSSVAAVLISKAIGKKLTCIFIDHGLLRENEALEVMNNFKKFGIEVTKVDAANQFLNSLKGVINPEEKRKIIGKAFIDVFNVEAKKLGKYKFLAQGTIYPDVVESGAKGASLVKSHHNVGGLPKDLGFVLLEPLNTLYKNQVQELGLLMQMPRKLIFRQPFPGPGLAIRIIGEVTNEKLDIVRKTDQILKEEIINHGLDKEIWQYFTVLTGIKTVGVKDQKRTFAFTVAIRAVYSVDGMSASWARIPYDVLDIIAKRMVTEVAGCNRVVLDVTGKPPSTIEWE